jgi:hypothetical protein
MPFNKTAMGIDWDVDFFEVFDTDYIATRSDTES